MEIVKKTWPSDAERGCTTRLLLTVISVAVGSCAQVGFHCGVISAPSQVIQKFYNSSQIDRRGTILTESTTRLLWAVTVSILCLGAAVGSILGGYAGDLIGRKRTLLANNVFSILAALLVVVFAQYLNVYETVIVARFLAGINSGVSFTVAGLYLAEISPINLRGTLLVAVSIGNNVGLIISLVLSFYVFNHDYDWDILIGLTPFLLSLFALITLPFSPESPRWLLLEKKDERNAREALTIFREDANIDDEIEEMYREAKLEEKCKVGVFHLFNPRNGRPEWRLPLAICVFFGAANSFSGMNMLWFYSSSLLASAGLSRNQISLSMVLFGVDALITSALCGRLCDRFGRRPVMLSSFVICTVLLASFCATAILEEKFPWMTWISIAIIFLFIMFWNFGPGPVIFIVCPELWAQGPRQASHSITLQLFWWGMFVCGQILPFLQKAIGAYTFAFFASVLFVSSIFFYFYVPETNNVTFGETTEYFRRRSLGLGPEDNEDVTKVRLSLLKTSQV
ncbi:solute carrier family 2, facilitated glucose transporter member 7-like isoform X2 [Amphiura filiformis]|uniref:solute carrier family 2, facilitated glucose transporter member 7-like isoform X2 n=1 Tax=Amphiura filiformis TaxID=82378 RepID=UPI003B21B523